MTEARSLTANFSLKSYTLLSPQVQGEPYLGLDHSPTDESHHCCPPDTGYDLQDGPVLESQSSSAALQSDDRGTVIDRKLFSQVLYPFSHRRFRGNRFWGRIIRPRNESHHCYSDTGMTLQDGPVLEFQFKFCQHHISMTEAWSLTANFLSSPILSSPQVQGEPFLGWKLQLWTTCNYTRMHSQDLYSTRGSNPEFLRIQIRHDYSHERR